MATTPMNPVDAAWYHMDGPANLAMVTGVMLARERFDFERVRDLFARRIVAFDRFRQRVVERGFPIASPCWDDMPGFDIDQHVHHARAAGAARPRRARPADRRHRERAARSRAAAVAGPRRRRRRRRQRAGHALPPLHRRRHRDDGGDPTRSPTRRRNRRRSRRQAARQTTPRRRTGLRIPVWPRSAAPRQAHWPPPSTPSCTRSSSSNARRWRCRAPRCWSTNS